MPTLRLTRPNPGGKETEMKDLLTKLANAASYASIIVLLGMVLLTALS